MKKDIQNRADIELLVNVFYKRIMEDEEMAFIFRQITKKINPAPLPAMYDFWENIILFSGAYQGNAAYMHMPQVSLLNETHFDKWDRFFISTMDELFEGKNASLALQRAINISGILKKKYLKRE